jgi:hypothetical protein
MSGQTSNRKRLSATKLECNTANPFISGRESLPATIVPGSEFLSGIADTRFSAKQNHFAQKVKIGPNSSRRSLQVRLGTPATEVFGV